MKEKKSWLRRFINSPFFQGAGTILDLSGETSLPPQKILSNREAQKADSKALSSDWKKVGNDIYEAMGKMEKEIQKKN